MESDLKNFPFSFELEAKFFIIAIIKFIFTELFLKIKLRLAVGVKGTSQENRRE